MGGHQETKPCVACAETIRFGAILCRFCRTRQDDPEFEVPRGEKQPKSRSHKTKNKFTCSSCGNPDAENFFCSLCGTELPSVETAEGQEKEYVRTCFRCSSSALKNGACQVCGYRQDDASSTKNKVGGTSNWRKVYEVSEQSSVTSSRGSSPAKAIAWVSAAVLVTSGVAILNLLPSDFLSSWLASSSTVEQTNETSQPGVQIDDTKACKLFTEGYELALSENGSAYGMGLWRSKAAEAIGMASDKLAFELKRFVQNSGEPTEIVANIAELCP